jgi:hypothetical protein
MSKLWDKERWPNFSPKEFLSPYGMAAFDMGILAINPLIVDEVQKLRTFIGKTILVNFGDMQRRGFRSQYENAAIPGAAKFSLHQFGLAADLTCPTMPAAELGAICHKRDFRAVGISEKKNFVHVDMRGFHCKDYQQLRFSYS